MTASSSLLCCLYRERIQGLRSESAMYLMSSSDEEEEAEEGGNGTSSSQYVHPRPNPDIDPAASATRSPTAVRDPHPSWPGVEEGLGWACVL